MHLPNHVALISDCKTLHVAYVDYVVTSVWDKMWASFCAPFDWWFHSNSPQQLQAVWIVWMIQDSDAVPMGNPVQASRICITPTMAAVKHASPTYSSGQVSGTAWPMVVKHGGKEDTRRPETWGTPRNSPTVFFTLLV